ncbi:ropporin-1-like protein [Halichondria panicea]|uniref:ropporin-1-like protein n=1 Tax=Halichondria panicea TaxID=6063 RepID=UPI00312B9A03
MDQLSEGPLYCAEQIKIPAQLPDILKEFTKAAIRTQPDDALQWSAAYFEALQNGEMPPVKRRLEVDLPPREERVGGLSVGALSVLHSQLGECVRVPLSQVQDKWRAVGCEQSKLDELLAIGNMSGEVEWLKLLALACTALDNSISAALASLCTILTSDPDGGPSRIPVDLFHTLYSYLAQIDGEISKENIALVMEFLNAESERYEGKVGPRDFQHASCPRLDSTRHR